MAGSVGSIWFVWFVWFKKSYSGERVGCHNCDAQQTDNGRIIKIRLESWDKLLCTGVATAKIQSTEFII